jgi:hypothetical protein
MAPIDDDTLDKLLTRHLSARLDGQVGRAETAFRRWVAEDPAFAAGPFAAGKNEAAPLPPMRLAGAAGDRQSDDASPARPGPWTPAPQAPFSPAARRLPAAGPWGRGRWLASIAATAVAASLATLFVLPQVSGPRPAPGGGNGPTRGTESPAGVAVAPAAPGGGPTSPAVGGPTMHYVHNQTWDEGMVLPDGSGGPPMRQLREQQVEHMRWYDPQRHATIDVVVPREKVRRYKLDTY